MEVLRRKAPDLPGPRTSTAEIAIPVLEEFLFTRDGAAVIVDYATSWPARRAPADELRGAATAATWTVADDPRLQRRNNFVFLLTETLAEWRTTSMRAARRRCGIPLADEAERLPTSPTCCSDRAAGEATAEPPRT